METLTARVKGYTVRRIYYARSCIRRSKIVNEIFDTENSFVDQLGKIIAYFKLPIEQSNGSILPKVVAHSLFHDIDNLMTAACRNANIFQKAVIDWKYDSCFGKVMLSCMQNMLPLTEYTLRWDVMKKELQNSYKNKVFRAFAGVQCSPKTTNGLSLEDLLITPVQRIMRYQTLLNELLKNTPIKHPDYLSLVKAHQQFYDLVISTNTRAKQHDLLIQSASIIFGMENLIQPWRYCLYYTECYVNGLEVRCECFIFNDMIAWMDSFVPIRDKSKYNYYFNFSPKNIVLIKDITKHFNSLRFPHCHDVITKEKHLMFFFSSNEVFDAWVNILKITLEK
ncbi:Rho/RAC guanine nucleotide exchange factor, putative [Entamoeba invadens IP1]|uniref:Rho/RAC guanine nucleotide exchange factor, putative n=1 Tax=Entamoeba invadens IP1 TaxID=370355 RepID=UPI0002C3E755|nr:Rho/RAC guanine nucleotide exchange factor, putative [Entamoeba invadens IP1]ELP93188.1 Rho/RAC guanine nucleotide exchange factor, putative [Entamoeba invadens IP1]|eukprot:XP_004259959.1 Rho/RAC guanine nucleotide exchange factor, putative [Entamoeba invadens IP1]